MTPVIVIVKFISILNIIQIWITEGAVYTFTPQNPLSANVNSIGYVCGTGIDACVDSWFPPGAATTRKLIICFPACACLSRACPSGFSFFYQLCFSIRIAPLCSATTRRAVCICQPSERVPSNVVAQALTS